MNELLKYLILNFWKIAGVLLFFLLGLSLVIFGFLKTLFIIAFCVLGYLLGKWKDEGVSLKQMLKKFSSSMRIKR
jgi:uncharacterized membrane protein